MHKRAAAFLPLIIFLSALFSAPRVEAGTANVTCTAPTTYTNTSAIPAGTTITYKLYRGASAAAVAASTASALTNTTCAFTDSSAPDGSTVFYAVTATVAGVESVKTNAVSVVIPPLTPNPPSNVQVQAVIAGTNFSPVFRFDERGGPLPRAAGLIEAGATCTGPVLFKRDGHAYRRISTKDVDVWFANENGRLAAACG